MAVYASPASFTFAAPNPGYIVVLNGGLPMTDVANDAPGSRDIVGDATHPMLYIGTDEAHVYFRLRVDEDPLQMSTNFAPYGWGCFVNTDGDLKTYEFSMLIDGVNNPDRILFFKNTTTTLSNSPVDPPDMPALSTSTEPLLASVGHAHVCSAPSTFGGTPDFFIDWVIDKDLAIANGFDPAVPASYYCGSSNNGIDLGGDCSGSAEDHCPLDSQFSDPIGCGIHGCAVCGDGAVNAGEACDDGNHVAGDGCSALCLWEIGQPCADDAECASGFCDPANGTCACDEDADCPSGSQCNTSLSPHECVAAGCGNGVLGTDEGCDDGNLTGGDGCGPACLLENGAPCSSSDACESDTCDPTTGVCVCDQDADCPAGQLCDTSRNPPACVDAICGNGTIELGEGCDDENTAAGDGCSAGCTVELGWTCAGTPSVCEPSECTSDSDCPLGRICDEETGECVIGNCSDDADCPPGKVCDPAKHVCVECVTDADCDGGICRTDTHTCEPPGTEPTDDRTGEPADDAADDPAGSTELFSPEGGGCACKVGSPAGDGNGLAVLGLLGLALARRRRRR